MIRQYVRKVIPPVPRIWLRRLMHRRLHKVQLRVPLRFHGSEYGGWAVADHLIDPESIVYSIGIGEDVSFDLSLVRSRGVTVHAFDPTPSALRWVRSQTMPAKWILHEYGVADVDGVRAFYAPSNPNHASYSMSYSNSIGTEPVTLPVKRLETIMKELNHDRIDVLKMDIEGAEYSVVRDIVACDIPIKQILIEFHHRMPQVGVEATREAVTALKSAGFAITAISSWGAEYSFLHENIASTAR